MGRLLRGQNLPIPYNTIHAHASSSWADKCIYQLRHQFFFLFFFLNMVLGSPSWPQTHHTAEASLEVLILVPLLQSSIAAELSRQNYSEL